MAENKFDDVLECWGDSGLLKPFIARTLKVNLIHVF